MHGILYGTLWKDHSTSKVSQPTDWEILLEMNLWIFFSFDSVEVFVFAVFMMNLRFDMNFKIVWQNMCTFDVWYICDMYVTFWVVKTYSGFKVSLPLFMC